MLSEDYGSLVNQGKNIILYLSRFQKTSCCSDYPISFHYITAQGMLLLESLVYHLHVYDKDLGSNVEGKLVNATNENIDNPQIRLNLDLDKDQGSLLYV